MMAGLIARPTHALILPPCRVCGDKASGIHYGINSCEACKGFFRRSFNRKRKYVCKGENGQCEISPGRNNCAFCRHQRCVHLGMSREGIQLGRHTYKQRMILQSEAQLASGNCINSYNVNDDIHIKQEPPDGDDYGVTDSISQYSSHQSTGESKSRRTTHRRARKQPRLDDDDNVIKCDENNNGFQNPLTNYPLVNQTDISYQGYNAGMDIYDSLSSPDFFHDSSSHVKSELSDPYSSGCSDTSSIYSTPLAYSGSIQDNYPYYSKQYFIEETKNYESPAMPDQQYEFKLQEVLDTLYGDGLGDKSLGSFTPNSCNNAVEDLMCEDMSEGRDLTSSPFSEYDVIVDSLVQANHLYNPSEWKFEDKEALKKKQLEFYDTVVKSSVKEDPQPDDDSPRADNNNLVPENDLQTGFLFYANHFELCAVNMIKFAKCIPGFKNLPVVDQEMLIKTAYCEYWLLGAFRTMNPDLEVVTLSTGACKTLHDFSRYVDETYVREMFSFAGRLQELELAYEEIAVLKAICITFRDRSLLECPDVVEDIQWHLINCFRHMLERRHRNPQQTFTKVIDRLIAMRDITYRDSKERFNLATRWPAIKDFKLLHEIASENF